MSDPKTQAPVTAEAQGAPSHVHEDLLPKDDNVSDTDLAHAQVRVADAVGTLPKPQRTEEDQAALANPPLAAPAP